MCRSLKRLRTGELLKPEKSQQCLKAINPVTLTNRSVRRNTSKPATRRGASARKPRKHGLGPPKTNSPAAAKRAAPTGRKTNCNYGRLNCQTSQSALESRPELVEPRPNNSSDI